MWTLAAGGTIGDVVRIEAGFGRRRTAVSSFRAGRVDVEVVLTQECGLTKHPAAARSPAGNAVQHPDWMRSVLAGPRVGAID